MTVRPQSEYQSEKISLKVAAQARLSLHLSKCHIAGNHMLWLNYYIQYFEKICLSVIELKIISNLKQYNNGPFISPIVSNNVLAMF